jgi:hypothetical protein
MIIIFRHINSKYLRWVLFALSFGLLAFCASCSTYTVKDPQKLAEETYRKDLKLEIDGKTYEGTAVLTRKTSYELTIFPEGKMDRLIIQNCHRDMTTDKPKTGWFSNKHTFRFMPIPGMEDNRSCPLEIASLEEKKTRNGFAYIDFQDSREEISLRAYMKCNGEYSTPQGVGICQAASGLRQSVFFQSQTLLEGVEGECDVMESKDGFFWEWNATPGKCIYYFVAREKHKNGKRLAFRLNALGYTSIPVRN